MDDPTEKLRESEDIKEFYLGIKEDAVRGKKRWRRKKTWR
jgi:branched-chain amino acid transport system ATP-binding protein